MARFNPHPGGVRTGKVNKAGGEAFEIDPKTELYSLVCTASLQDKHYEKAAETIMRLRRLIPMVPPEFVAKLGVYAREQMYLRSIPLVLAVELARVHRGDDLVRKMAFRVIQRADELTEILAYYEQANGRSGKFGKISTQLKKGVADAFGKFNEYQFGKYDREGKFALRDALFLTHPKPTDLDREALYKKIAEKTLAVPYTWETELSALGQQGFASEAAKKAAFKAKWEELIVSGRMGYMALLRNLRNIIEAGVSDAALGAAFAQLTDPEAVAKSKQFPFRFLSAWKELSEIPSYHGHILLAGLEQALGLSVVNVPVAPEEKIVIACDVSGSMFGLPISARSKIRNVDIGMTLGVLLNSKCEQTIFGIFGDTWRTVALDKGNTTLKNIALVERRANSVGFSTNGHKVADWIAETRTPVDRLMLFTDCQLWNSTPYSGAMSRSWSLVKEQNPGARLYIFDVAGHGAAPVQLDEPDVAMIAGWSDKVFDVLSALENGQAALSKIEGLTL